MRRKELSSWRVGMPAAATDALLVPAPFPCPSTAPFTGKFQ